MIGLTEVAIIFITGVLSILVYFKWIYQYWARKGIPYIEPSIPWGTTKNPFTTNTSFTVDTKLHYEEFKSKGYDYGGLFLMNQPSLLAVKPEFIKTILTKDFIYFNSHGVHVDEKTDPISGNLFNVDGERWRNLRVKLTPTFTSGKMKMMFPTLLVCGNPMIDYVDKLIKDRKPLDIKEILACFTTDVIGSIAFGIDCNSFKYPDAAFRKYGKKFFETTWKSNVYRILNAIIPNIRLTERDIETREFFMKSFEEIVKQRVDKNFKRSDFVQLLLELRDKAGAEGTKDSFTMNQMTAQAVMFFAAGFETSSTTMTFALHQLSYNLDIQEKARIEIIDTMNKYDGKLTYDGIMEMKYLDMVIDEALRITPAVGALPRVCSKDYTLPTGAVIKKGTPVFISILGLHRDPEYFPNPDKFDPERFSEENKSKIPHFSYLPFGEGPRICIGLRFGVMQAKVGLCLLLKNFIFTPHESMRYDMGGFHKSSIVLAFSDTLLLNAERIV